MSDSKASRLQSFNHKLKVGDSNLDIIFKLCYNLLDIFKDSSRDFYETARISSKNIHGNLSLISEINSRGKVMNMQELESLLENLNKVVPQSQDEEHQRVAREYASLNESLFQCLESHRYLKV